LERGTLIAQLAVVIFITMSMITETFAIATHLRGKMMSDGENREVYPEQGP
jgi:hypothetical protein